MEDCDCGNDRLPVSSKLVGDLLINLDAYKFMGPNEIHPKVLRELADVTVRPLSVIFERLW